VVVQVATPEPLSVWAPQPVIGLAPSEKATVPASGVGRHRGGEGDAPDRRGVWRGPEVVVVAVRGVFTVWLTVPVLPRWWHRRCRWR
jgi:hypothetical protein